MWVESVRVPMCAMSMCMGGECKSANMCVMSMCMGGECKSAEFCGWRSVGFDRG